MTTISEGTVHPVPAVPGPLDLVRKILFGRPTTIFASGIIALFVIVAALAPWLSPYDPLAQSMLKINKLPSWQNWLGTDQFGRDVLSRMIYGSRNSLLFGFISPILAAIVGTLLGVVAGYFAERLRTARLIPAPESNAVVAFGSTVTFSRDDGRVQTYRIVGEDEADPKAGSISYVSPIAQALMGKAVDDAVSVGEHELEVVTIA